MGIAFVYLAAAAPAAVAPVAAESADAAISAPAEIERRSRHRADRRAERNRRWYANGFLLKESEARLPTFPYKIVTATLPFRNAYAVELGGAYVAVPRFAIPLPGFKLRGNSLDLEGDFLQHFGLEKDSEVAGAAVLRFGSFGLIGWTSLDLAWGNGLSYAITSPTYELGREGERGVDTIHLQYHMMFEAELSSGANPRLHYVLRLHHRSGIYGIISPARTGSNYLGLGLRYDFGRR